MELKRNSHREVLVLGLGEGSVVDGVDDGSGVLERASLSLTELSAGPGRGREGCDEHKMR
jgi:hypothetical protein